MSVRKKFDKELYKENDEIAKRIASLVATKKYGYEVKQNPDQYGVDLLLFKNGLISGYAEAEIKTVWDTFNFPYENIQFPERKIKFTNLGLPTMFCMANSLKDRALVVWGKDLRASPIVEVSNKYNAKGELFFQVPLEKAIFYTIKLRTE